MSFTEMRKSRREIRLGREIASKILAFNHALFLSLKFKELFRDQRESKF